MQRLQILLILLFFGSTSARADFNDFLDRCKEYLDNTDVAGCDDDYIEPTEQPWAVYFSLNLSGTRLRTSLNEGTSAKMNTKADFQWQLSGAYRGWGLSYSRNIGSSSGQQFKMSSYGSRYGWDLNFSQSNTFHGKIKQDGKTVFTATSGMTNVNQRMADFYYVFNYKRFSYPAAFTCTVRQLRSSGSPIIGLSYYHSTLQVNDDSLAHKWDNMHGLSLRSLSIGAGGAYNRIFGSDDNFLFHISAMPQAAILHKNRVRNAEGNQKIEDEWNNWNQSENNDSNSGSNNGNQVQNLWGNVNKNSIKLTFTGRLALNYNYERSVLGLSLVWRQNDIGSSKALSVKYINWNVRAFYGFRF